MSDAPPPIVRRLRRAEAAAELTRQGYKTSTSTLATMATRGGGPPYRKFGPHLVLYDYDELITWAEARLKPSKKP